MKKIFYASIAFTGFIFGCLVNANAQGVSVNVNGSPPDNSAMMDISSTTKGTLIPRMSTSERNAITSPAYGLTIFNTDCGVFNFNAGTPGSPNWAVINSSNALIAGISIIASPAGTVCSGNSVTFTAILTNSNIPSPSYQWQVNGNNVGSNSPTFTVDTLQSNDIVTCVLSSSANCVVGSPATSNSIVMNVISKPSTPGAISGPDTVCASASGQVYSINSVSGATGYNWTVPAGATITVNADTAITVTFGSTISGNVAVAASNSCGTSSQSTLSLYQPSLCSPYSLSYTGSLQTFSVPAGVTSLTIEGWGAQGGSTTGQSNNGYWTGGLGADIKGTFSVSPGQVLTVLVGGAGGVAQSSCTTGGGGGTFVVYNGTLLLAAGGGGGGFNCNYYGGVNGGPGQAGNNGQNGVNAAAAQPGAAGGTGGDGGSSGGCDGGAGGGWLTAGACSLGGNAYPGAANVNGGGFGGGGGGLDECCGASGGGGGYSGGGSASGDGCAGGGGGSYNNGSNQSNTAGVQSGNGKVTFSW